MIPAAERMAQPSTETFGLSHDQNHLIAKLRLGLVPADVLNKIHPTQEKEAA
ncbi:hypothetical protein SEA_JINKIES_67 [Arthrobacter phage Jinkies]|uniref:Uncharacterized protein n=1 Tax=Arthrobacter phage Jinkies TaxID=2743903 RepID=A0A7T0IFG0_9CAUD|nr:hypothetical protein SEA_JINKIES_67 [Arthrobacter phage Jinkies]